MSSLVEVFFKKFMNVSNELILNPFVVHGEEVLPHFLWVDTWYFKYWWQLIFSYKQQLCMWYEDISNFGFHLFDEDKSVKGYIKMLIYFFSFTPSFTFTVALFEVWLTYVWWSIIIIAYFCVKYCCFHDQ